MCAYYSSLVYPTINDVLHICSPHSLSTTYPSHWASGQILHPPEKSGRKELWCSWEPFRSEEWFTTVSCIGCVLLMSFTLRDNAPSSKLAAIELKDHREIGVLHVTQYTEKRSQANVAPSLPQIHKQNSPVDNDRTTNPKYHTPINSN